MLAVFAAEAVRRAASGTKSGTLGPGAAAGALNLAALAAAQASAGDRAGATRSQRDAIARAKRFGWSVDEMEQRLAGYEAGRPCEEPFLPPAGLPWQNPPWR